MAGLFAWLNDALGDTNMGSMPPSMLDPSGGGGQPPMQPPMPPGTDPMGNQTGMGMNTAPPMPPMPPMASPGPQPGPGPIPPNPTTAMGDQTGAMPQIGQPPAPPPIGSPETGMASGPPPGVMYPPGGDPMQSAGLNPGGLPPKPGAPPPMPPGPPMSIAPPGGVPPNPPPVVMGAGPDMAGQRAQARTILGRALGLDQNTEAQMRGSVGAGLKAAGENSNKGKGAAFMGSAGSAIEGGKGADDKTTDQQDKVLARAIQSKTADQAATNAGVTNRLNEARTKLATEQAKMTASGSGSGVMNSQQQLYLRGMALVNNDPEVKLAKSTYDAAIKVGDAKSPEVIAAKKAHEELVAAKTKAHLEALGVDPKIAEKLGKQPGMSQDNPMPSKGLTQEKLNALPPGTYVTGPDGKVMQKKAPVAPAAGANQPVPAQAMTPAVQPPLPPAVANARASTGADDEED